MSERHQDTFVPGPAWDGPPTCVECGSERLQDGAAYYATGVEGPEGEPEIVWHDYVRCLDCGWTEDWG